MKFSIFTVNVDQVKVPLHFAITDVGSSAIVPLSFSASAPYDNNSTSTYGVRAGIDAFKIESDADSMHNHLGSLFYAAGIIGFNPLLVPSGNRTVTFNIKTVPLTSYAGTLNLPSGSIVVGELNTLRPGSVRFVATMKVFSKVSVVAAATHQLETQETPELETSVQVLVIDKPIYTGLVGNTEYVAEFVEGVSNVTGELHFLHKGSPIRAGTINYVTGEVVLDYEHVASDVGVFLYDNVPDFDMLTVVGTESLIKRYTWHSICTTLHTHGGVSITPRQRYELTGVQSATQVKYSHTGEVETPLTFGVQVTDISTTVAVPAAGTVEEVTFTLGGTQYVAQGETVVSSPSPTTGVGTTVGTLEPSTGVVTLTTLPQTTTLTADNVTVATAPPPSKVTCNKITIRTASAPLRPGSVSVSWTSPSPSPFGADSNHTATANLDGYFDTDDVIGIVDYERGVIQLWFTTAYIRSVGGDLPLSNFSNLGIPGVTTRKSWMARTASLRYNAVAYSYLPLNADLLGVDPVRLPSDGRVPIFRPGGFVVVGHTGEITATVSNGQTVNCARTRLSRVRVIGDNGAVINTGYSADLNAGTVTFSDVSGYSQPVTIQHRIEDMVMTSDVQINGQLTFTRALTHDYPVGSYVSSALVAGDLRARVSVVFDQATWNGSSWLDAVSGAAAVATFNDAQFPITVTNRGALTERWIVQFTNTTAFNVIGEHVGVIATGNVSTNCAPLNPATNVPYFTIPAGGWGAGWTTGNVLRFNTIGSIFPVWCVRTVQQGPETVTDDNFTILVRGDIDTP